MSAFKQTADATDALILPTKDNLQWVRCTLHRQRWGGLVRFSSRRYQFESLDYWWKEIGSHPWLITNACLLRLSVSGLLSLILIHSSTRNLRGKSLYNVTYVEIREWKSNTTPWLSVRKHVYTEFQHLAIYISSKSPILYHIARMLYLRLEYHSKFLYWSRTIPKNVKLSLDKFLAICRVIWLNWLENNLHLIFINDVHRNNVVPTLW